nr:MAG TPA: capsid fiber protein [Caudoviricetes sp.]
MSKLSFDGIGAVVATFEADEGVKGGQVVKLTGNNKVGPCSAGDAFCGVALEPRAGFVAVQVRGFVTVSGTQSLSAGQTALVADGKGSVKIGSGGEKILVASVEADGTAVLCL